ncbi:MAG: restriction endonuclease subunit S [Treponema succinifaciens]|uniref:restriction endonuclease subunit S n=1 Tax=Treponema succinifaciens TaxID=167 RepID=UPI0023F0A56C|nr:restriction endonuclease subunit S [Treponema succinifaciens]UKI55564.1 MAG: restriction endonuclease subunit S [Treponema succinifaciens]
MEDWKEYRLGEMIQCNPQVKLEKGKSYNLIDIDSIEIGSRYVKGKELTVYDGQSGCHFQNGDTVMARITPCLENGKIAQVQCESQKGFGSTELFVFRGTENKTDSDYVFNLMSMQFIRNLAANSMTGASGRQRADLGFIKRIKWNFPPLPTQQKIASILSAYDNLIQNYKKQIEALQTGACELYKEWFVRFRFPGYQTAEFENGIPEGWKIERIGNIGEVIGGGTPSTENEEYWDGDIPWLSPVDLSDNTNVYVSRGGKNITKLGLQKSSAKMMPKDTVLLSSRAPVGYVALAKNPICTNQGFKSVVCNTSVIQPIYLYFYFRMNKNYLQSIASGATFPELSGSMMKKLKVLLPQMELQKEFSKKANIFISKAELLSEQITNLTQQRDLLLPRLMRGALEVH